MLSGGRFSPSAFAISLKMCTFAAAFRVTDGRKIGE